MPAIRCSSRTALLFCGVMVAAVAVSAPSSGGELPQFRTACARAHNSIVLVRGLAARGAREACSEDRCTGRSTGFFVTDDGYVLTSMYAIGGCREIEVVRVDGARASAKVVGVDQKTSLALLETTFKTSSPLVPASEPAEPGEWVLLASAYAPHGESMGVMFSANLLSPARAPLRLRGVRWKDFLVGALTTRNMAAAVPVLNVRGEWVGTVAAVAEPTAESALFYAIRTADVNVVMDDLKQGKSRWLGWIGLRLAEVENDEGLIVEGMLEGGPADEAGIRPGDLLVEVAGAAITRSSVLTDKVVNSAPGTVLKIKLTRGTRTKTVNVALRPRPLFVSTTRKWRTPREPWTSAPPPRWVERDEVESVWSYAIRELARQNEQLRARIDALEAELATMRSKSWD